VISVFLLKYAGIKYSCVLFVWVNTGIFCSVIPSWRGAQIWLHVLTRPKYCVRHVTPVIGTSERMWWSYLFMSVEDIPCSISTISCHSVLYEPEYCTQYSLVAVQYICLIINIIYTFSVTLSKSFRSLKIILKRHSHYMVSGGDIFFKQRSV